MEKTNEMLTLEKVIDRYQLSRKTIMRYIANGTLTPEKNGVEISFSTDELLKFEQKFEKNVKEFDINKKYYTINDISQKYNIPRPTVVEWVSYSKKLPSTLFPTTGNYGFRRIHACDIEEIINKQKEILDTTLSTKDIMIKYNISAEDIIQKFIETGSLTSSHKFNKKSGKGYYRFSASDIRRFEERFGNDTSKKSDVDLLTEKYISIAQAGKILKVNPATLYYWVKKEILPTVTINSKLLFSYATIYERLTAQQENNNEPKSANLTIETWKIAQKMKKEGVDDDTIFRVIGIYLNVARKPAHLGDGMNCDGV